MNDKTTPTSTPGSDDAVMPKEAAELADEAAASVDATTDQERKLKKEVAEATDLPQKGSA